MKPEHEQMLKELHTAIVGNEQYGHKGLVRVTKDLDERLVVSEKKQMEVEKKMLIFGALGTGVALGFRGIWDYLTKILM